MKYLKLFEGDSYYQEIDHGEYVVKANSQHPANDIFTEKEIDILKKRYSSFRTKLLKKSDFFSDFVEDGSICVDLSNHHESEYVHISKLEDEWFYVSIHISSPSRRMEIMKRNSYYKCDQFDGLISVLDKFFNIGENLLDKKILNK